MDEQLKQAIANAEMERAIYATHARTMWDQMTESERLCVRFGMFPAGKMRDAEELFTDPFEGKPKDFGRKMAVALMDVAKQHGGMRA